MGRGIAFLGRYHTSNGCVVRNSQIAAFMYATKVYRRENSPICLLSSMAQESIEDKQGTTYPDMPWEPKEAFKAVADYFAER